MTEIQIKDTHQWAVHDIKPGVTEGPYNLVAIMKPLDTLGKLSKEEPPILVWFNKETGQTIEQELVARDRPFKLILLDLDGLLIDSEGPDRYFAASWGGLFREAGIEGSNSELDALRKRVYVWERTLPISTGRMIQRIKKGIDRYGNPLSAEEKQMFQKLLDSQTLELWARKNGQTSRNPATIIANRKEQIGKDLLAKNPELVLELAPFKPGALEFVNSIPNDVLVAIASGSRVKSTVLPILQAHAAVGNPTLIDRVGNLIVGEDTLFGDESKPDRYYYTDAVITLARILKGENRIPAGGIRGKDIVYLGDVIARSPTPDVPLTRKTFSHIVIDPTINPETLGPFAAAAPSFTALIEELSKPKEQIKNPIVARLASTLRESRRARLASTISR